MNQSPNLQLVRRALNDGDVAYCSEVQKQTKNGFGYKRRLLAIVGNEFICYYRNPILDLPADKMSLKEKAKDWVALDQLERVQSDPKDLKLKIYFHKYEKDKKISRYWLFRMRNLKLITQWEQIIDQSTNRSRKGTKDRKSPAAVNIPVEKTQMTNRSIIPVTNQLQNQNSANYYPRSQIEYSKFAVANGQNSKQQFDVKKLNPVKQVVQVQTETNPLGFIQREKARITPSEQNKQLREPYFISAKDNRYNQQIPIDPFHDFKNYYRPYPPKTLSKLDQIKQLNCINKKYCNFTEYSRQQIRQLIDNKIRKGKKLMSDFHSKELAEFLKQQQKQLIRFDELNDVTITIALTELKSVADNNKVCDQSLRKILGSELKNMDYLYEVISEDEQLSTIFSLPMSCVVQYRGYTCIVASKIEPVNQDTYNQAQKVPDIYLSFQKLAQKSRISYEMFENQSIIKFVPRNISKTKFVITHCKQYLPFLEQTLLLRKQMFKQIYVPSASCPIYNYKGSRQENEMQLKMMKTNLSQAATQFAQLMDKLEIYPMHPTELSLMLHSHGLNIKYISQVYAKINSIFIRRILITEAASRSIKMINSQKMQEEITADPKKEDETSTVRSLLNLILGNSPQSNLFWKIITIHSQVYFNIPCETGNIDKGYFLLALAQHLCLQISPKYDNVSKVFQVNNFVQSIKFVCKVKPPNLMSNQLMKVEQHWQLDEEKDTIDNIINDYRLDELDIPQYVRDRPVLASKLLNMLALYVKPNNYEFKHLDIYGIKSKQHLRTSNDSPCLLLRRKMLQIKWAIKGNEDNSYIMQLFTQLKNQTISSFGQSHPFLSEILELQSIYHMSNYAFVLAITANKQSLTNMIQCCGSNTKHLKLANNNFQLGECYSKCRHFQEAVSSYRKAKNILEINSYQTRPEYAIVLYRLGMISLQLLKDQEAYHLFINSMKILEAESIFAQYWSELVDLYEAIYRCDFKNNHKEGFYHSHLAQHCVSMLHKIIREEERNGQYICTDEQLQRMLRIILEEYLKGMEKQAKKVFRIYILQLSNSLSLSEQGLSEELQQGVKYFRAQLASDNFIRQLTQHIDTTTSILTQMCKEKKLMSTSSRRSPVVQSYEEFMRCLAVTLGQGCLLNIL